VGAADPDARPGAQAPPVVVDALLGTAVALAVALIIAVDRGGDRPPDALAYLFALGFGALVLLRRRAPRVVLVLTVLGLFAYYTFGYPPIGVAVPLVAALFGAADSGLTRWAAGAGAVVFAVSVHFRIGEGEALASLLLGYEAVSNLALIAAAIALGYGARARRTGAAQQAEITRLTALQAVREAEARMQRERERISRDLHDTVGHTMSVIALQAGVATEAVGAASPAATEALDRIRAASGATLRDLRSMVRLLRSAAPADDGSDVLSLTAVPDLVDAATSAGVAVSTRIDVDPARLSPPVDAAAYRIVQESLTNVVRHAAAGRVALVVELRDGALHVGVTDDGRGARPGPGEGEGQGLAGMAERVRLLGGSLRTRTAPGEGFAVEARIPVGADR
jgi:signal transduction histidine kinase